MKLIHETLEGFFYCVVWYTLHLLSVSLVLCSYFSIIFFILLVAQVLGLENTPAVTPFLFLKVCLSSGVAWYIGNALIKILKR